MSAESDYISAESANILRCAKMIEDLLGRETLPQYEVIALGKLLQDVYTGIERILRAVLEGRGVRIRKTESWHKDLLLAARDESLISKTQFQPLRNLLLFRHMQVHGYGFTLEERRLREIARPVPGICKDFLATLP